MITYLLKNRDFFQPSKALKKIIFYIFFVLRREPPYFGGLLNFSKSIGLY